MFKSFLTGIYNKIKSALPGFDYQMNDPATPALVVHVSVPELPSPCPPFSVQGWNGVGAPPGSLQFQAAEVYITIVTSLRFINSKLEVPIGNWPATHNLIAVPRAGRDFNAYYDRSALRFFFNQNTAGKMVYTCESPDIVSHELGHGLLDALRPDIWGLQALEIFAFHESFGDMNAILTALSHEEVIDYVIKETGGNIRHSNVVSRLAEEMGAAIYALTGGVGGRQADALRNAVNSFSYATPESLPQNAPDNQLAGEAHSFSRVFTGAFYDMLTMLYEKYAVNNEPRQALAMSRDLAARVLYNAVRQAHVSIRFYDAVVRAMLATDQHFGGECSDIINKAFSERKILMGIARATKPTTMKMDYSRDCKVYNFTGGSTVRIGGVKTIKLSKSMILPQSTETNPLYGVEVDIPNDHYLEYNDSGKLLFELPVDKQATLEAVKKCLDYIHATKQVSWGDLDETQFKVVNNKLIRNHFCI